MLAFGNLDRINIRLKVFVIRIAVVSLRLAEYQNIETICLAHQQPSGEIIQAYRFPLKLEFL